LDTEVDVERGRISVITLLFALVVSLPTFAQERHVADRAILDQVIADHADQAADDREAIRRVLEIEQVRQLAEEVGLDLRSAEAAVATLDDVEAATIAAQARTVTDALAGGQGNVTISTTVIIIVLLLLILIIVAV
jgi:hypothetical protein